MSSDPHYGELRVVIEVSGGVAEENTNLARGPVTTIIVDWDDIKASSPKQLKKLLAEYPADVREYIQSFSTPDDTEY